MFSSISFPCISCACVAGVVFAGVVFAGVVFAGVVFDKGAQSGIMDKSSAQSGIIDGSGISKVWTFDVRTFDVLLLSSAHGCRACLRLCRLRFCRSRRRTSCAAERRAVGDSFGLFGSAP